MSKGVFEEHRKARITYGDSPDIADKIWMDKTNDLIYSYDSVRGVWLSSSRHHVIFYKKGRVSGMYLPLSTESLVETSLATTLLNTKNIDSIESLDSLLDVYIPGNYATIMSIFCRSQRGSLTQRFELRKNGQPFYNFSYGGQNLFYINNNLNLEMDPYDEIKLYIYKKKIALKNTVCRIETAWRYV